MEISKEMTIHEVLTLKPQTAEVFFGMGMHCLGCPISKGETVEEAAAAHNNDIDELIEKLNNI